MIYSILPCLLIFLQGVKLTDKERRDLEYKEQVYKLAVERKKQLGELIITSLLQAVCAAAMVHRWQGAQGSCRGSHAGLLGGRSTR